MKKLIYLDNAATSHFKPRCVIKTFLKALKFSANPGRSGHNLSLKNAINVYNTREIIAKHFNAPNPNFVIFTKNCTEALNLVILGLLNSTNNTQKKHVICSCFEHNSILRPLTHLKEQNIIDLTVLTPSEAPRITVNDLKTTIKHNTYLVCLTHVSNVIGTEINIKEIGEFCKNNKILFLLDCAQSVGHIKIDMHNSNINYLVFAGHKGFLSPQGIGGLLINNSILPNPINFGGTGTDSISLTQPTSPPECFESGTIMTPNILALSSGVLYIDKYFQIHNKKIEKLTKFLMQELVKLEEKNIVKIYSPKDVKYGVISFNLTNLDSTNVSSILNKKYNIAVRSGLHCAPLTHKFFNTEKTGMVRISLNFKNNKLELKKLIKAIINIYNLNKS